MKINEAPTGGLIKEVLELRKYEKEIISTIEDLEGQVEALQEEVDNLKDPDYGKPDPYDEYMENRFQNE